MPRSTICADTGNGATLTCAEGITTPFKYRSFDPSEESVGRIECSDISTTGRKKYIPEDLAETAELTVEWNWDTFDVPPAVGLNLGLVTLTYPLRAGETTPATRAGSGYVSAVKHPRLENGVLQTGMLKIQFDNVTPLVYTKST